MVHIRTIPHAEVTGRLKEIYEKLVQKLGKLTGVHQIQSLRV